MGRIRIRTSATCVAAALLFAAALCAAPHAAHAAAQGGVSYTGTPVRAAASATVTMSVLARRDAARPHGGAAGLTRVAPAPRGPAEPRSAAPAGPGVPGLFDPLRAAAQTPQASSPAPAQDFAGLDDIADLSTGDRIIPPDTDGAVGLTKLMSGLNNDYRIFTKATGAVVSTVGTETFWSGLGGSDFFDPKTLYDPVTDRWLVVMLSDPASAASSINVGVSQTSDPSGSYHLFRVDADATNANWADFPTIGFNRDYVAVNVNMFSNADDDYVSSKMLVIDYAQMRAGTWRSWFVGGSQFCSSPAATYSAGESTLYVPTHWNSASGTYRLDRITGDPSSGPVYTAGAVKSRGVTWSDPGGQVLPQKPAGGGTPRKIETQDAEIRSTPVVRDGVVYYTQTVGLPAGGNPKRTSILWTKLTASTGSVAAGGLIDDPAATATNGGRWYSYPHIAVNRYGDVIVGFSQFSSTQWASAGYAVRLAGDAAGSMRDPVVYKAGEDVYEKTYGTTRNRWGDYSKAQVDPSNDEDLWVLNEYAKPITGPDDYGGVWGTWWARVDLAAPAGFTITPSVVGGHGDIDPATPQTVSPGSTPTFAFAPDGGYRVDEVLVDGAEVAMTGTNRYTFPPVTADHAVSVAFTVKTAPLLGKPTCPVTAPRGASFKVYGTLAPRFPAGARTVSVKTYRSAGGTWKPYKTYTAVNSNAGSVSRYTASVRITTTGRYRFRATTAATATWAAAQSTYSRTLTVK